ncbi:NAD(P)/FAD-dependent oxidoreductase [Rhodococcus sp. USK10]|uniref:flavin-containing monooxygenase n=1 Tax=Rhodococcus sp. USK10 TaxID=2789739 RepID=UPI002151F1EB|nr:NAD(P)/FAD-dependent oxidoreductase [Rhodococcus sp. USK10]
MNDAPLITDHDAIVVGAGFAGLYALHKLRDVLGLNVRVFEAGDGVGGMWFWNRYPGARCDIESLHYSYSFSDKLQDEWNWSEKYAGQPEILAYLEHVADRFDLRPNIVFGRRVTSAVRDEEDLVWRVGIDDFEGEVYLTGKWSHDGVVFHGKKVGVIGTGSRGIQAITEIAKKAGYLTVFQRTPNYATRLGNAPSDPDRVAPINLDTQRFVKSLKTPVGALSEMCCFGAGGVIGRAPPGLR